MINQTRQQTKYCLGLSSQSSKKGSNNNYNSYNNNNNNGNSNHYSNNNEEDEAAIEKMRKDIEVNQDSALNLCTEKVLLAQQAYDLVCLFGFSLFLFLLSFFKMFGYYGICLSIMFRSLDNVVKCLLKRIRDMLSC